jgi:peptidoglycan hydrolase FlgJ
MTTPISMGTVLPGAAMSSLDSAPAVDTAAATTYTDVNALEALKRDPNSPQAISAVAQQVEAMFLQMMLKSMREASAADNSDSSEMGMYEDMFDKQVALSISQHADIGIGRLLKKQLGGKSAPLKGLTMGTPTASIGHTPADFVNKMLPAVRRAANSLGVNPEPLLAQAALETGWGQRMPRNADGSPSYNMFGIKAGEEWSGARAAADTMEVVNGVATPRRTAFRAYGSIEESVNDFAKLLASSPRYKEALAAGGDAQAYIAGIGKSGYATDPEYANKLNQILDSGTIQAVLNPALAKL